jgi:ankyrin repeat protein
MEIIFKRFPLLGEKISNNIDDENLVKLKESSQELSKLLDHQRFYWIRIIKHYKDNLQAFQENWMKIINNTPIAIVKELAVATQKFFKASYVIYISPWNQKWSALHISGQQGSIKLCKYIFNRTDERNPGSETAIEPFASCQLTPLHLAAQEGHLEVYQCIFERVRDKNPFDIFNQSPIVYAQDEKMCRLIVDTATNPNPENHFGNSPLHLAASTGDLIKCKVIMECLMDKHPRNCYGETPLHFLALKLHNPTMCSLSYSHLNPRNSSDLISDYLEVYKYILKNVLDKNPTDNTGQTPLHVALNGRLTRQRCSLVNVNLNKEVIKFILENIDIKNPEDNNGVTPKDIALEYGYCEIFELIDDYLPKDQWGLLYRNH